MKYFFSLTKGSEFAECSTSHIIPSNLKSLDSNTDTYSFRIHRTLNSVQNDDVHCCAVCIVHSAL